MNPLKIIAALVLLAIFSANTSIYCYSDDPVKKEAVQPVDAAVEAGIPSMTHVGFADGSPAEGAISDLPVSVPEPATFGLISLALAVGGGLLIRRKSD